MDEMLTIELPGVDKPEDLLILQILVMTIEGVADAGMLDVAAGSLDLGLWVQIETRFLVAAKTAVPLIDKIVGLVHEQGIEGAKLRMGKGTIDIDQVTTNQIEEFLAGSKAYSPHN